MNILQICNKSPYPPIEGGPIAMSAIASGLNEAGHSVKILAMNTPKYATPKENIPEGYLKTFQFETVFVNTSIQLHKAFLNLFSSKSYIAERFIATDFEKKIIQILQSNQYDIIQLESIFVAPYIKTIRQFSKAKIVIRAHNIEHYIWERTAANCSNLLKKWYLLHLAKTLKKFELQVLSQADGIAAITPFDANNFKNEGVLKPILFIPAGININTIPALKTKRNFPGIFHLGSMDWMPNQNGIKWFLENIWKEVVNTFPDMQIEIAGRKMPEWLKNYNDKGVKIIGEVDNAIDFYLSNTIMIVPLLSGSGMRIKIMEGMACGNTIISTTIGAEGIHVSPEKNILIADTPLEFVNQIKKCIENPEKCNNIGMEAQKFIKEEYNNELIIKKLIDFYKQL